MESDTKISDLKISYRSKEIMKNLGFEYVSDLQNHNFYTIKKINSKPYPICDVIREFMELGYLLLPDYEVCIYDIQMSSRLINILKNNQIMYLSQLSQYSLEWLLNLRNMGPITIKELESICNSYRICLKSSIPIKMAFKDYGITDSFHIEILFRNNIYSINDLKNKSNSFLYEKCGYGLAMKLYYILRDENLSDSNSSQKGYFIFEILTRKQATELWKRRKIGTLDDLSKFSIDYISKLKSLNPTALNKLSDALSSYGLSFQTIKGSEDC